jgi:hypothetical protein
MFVYFDQICNISHTFILFTEPTGFIIAVGNDPDSYKGSQLSLPNPTNSGTKEVSMTVEKVEVAPSIVELVLTVVQALMMN